MRHKWTLFFIVIFLLFIKAAAGSAQRAPHTLEGGWYLVGPSDNSWCGTDSLRVFEAPRKTGTRYQCITVKSSATKEVVRESDQWTKMTFALPAKLHDVTAYMLSFDSRKIPAPIGAATSTQRVRVSKNETLAPPARVDTITVYRTDTLRMPGTTTYRVDTLKFTQFDTVRFERKEKSCWRSWKCPLATALVVGAAAAACAEWCDNGNVHQRTDVDVDVNGHTTSVHKGIRIPISGIVRAIQRR